jgi:polysaccharide chain length determinant protein (PEP-CTERM system associated)
MTDYQLTLSDYLAIALRRKWLIAGTFAAALALGVIVSLLIPPVYRSAGSILIESQQIPSDLAPANVTTYADERIEVIKQRVMTRDNLLRVIARHGLFADAGPGFTPSEQVDVMRKAIAVELVQANMDPNRSGPATISFSIAFEHRRPEVAQAVANDLVTLFIDENVKVRTQRAAQTTEFLTQEADKLKKEVDAIEAQVAKYKQEHANGLPENVALGMASMQRVEADLRQVERDHAGAEEALRTLEGERAAAMAEPPPAVTATVDPTQAELRTARAELARLAATYTENHPDLRAAKRKVEALERVAATESANSPAAAARRSPAAVAAARFDGRANALRERVRVLAAQKASLRQKLSEMDVSLVRSPQVERGLLALTRDYQSAQKKYEEILSKKMTAQMAENLEGGQKAERFAVLDAPTVPDNPIRPNRKKLLAMSFILALVAAAATVALVEAMRGTVRGIGQIRAIWGQEPLVAVPIIPVPGESAQQRKRVMAAAGSAALVGCVILGLVHFLFVPLDQLVMKAITRMG